MTDSQATMVARAPALPLAFASVNPLECGDEIKQLFVDHERPEFPAFFDRTYPDVVKDGARSCVGRDPSGRLCAHIAQFPRSLRLGTRVVRASLLGNLMVATPYRTLWPGLSLVRHLVNNCKGSGTTDLLYGDPNEAAMAITRVVGFRVVGALQRFVAPVFDRRVGVNLGVRVYQLLQRLRVRGPTLDIDAQAAVEVPGGPSVADAADPGVLIPALRPAVYRHRLPGYPGAGDTWYTLRRRHESEPIGAVLVRAPDRPDRNDLGVISAVQGVPLALLDAVLIRVIRALRRTGIARVEVSLMDGSRAAAAARRAGFVAREERISVVALPLTALGTEALQAAEWRLLPVDLDR